MYEGVLDTRILIMELRHIKFWWYKVSIWAVSYPECGG